MILHLEIHRRTFGSKRKLKVWQARYAYQDQKIVDSCKVEPCKIIPCDVLEFVGKEDDIERLYFLLKNTMPRLPVIMHTQQKVM